MRIAFEMIRGELDVFVVTSRLRLLAPTVGKMAAYHKSPGGREALSLPELGLDPIRLRHCDATID